MKKNGILFIYCFILGISPAWACSAVGADRGWYVVRDGQVYFNPDKGNKSVLIEEIDIATLENMDQRFPNSDEERKLYFSDYVADKNHVYYRGRILEGMNPAQREFLSQRFDQIALVDGLDKYVSYEDRQRWDGYLKDNKYVYYYGRLLEGANGEYFKWLPLYKDHNRNGNDYTHDNQHIYLYGQKVAGDPNTALELDYGYYLDATHIYFHGEVLEGATPDAFEYKGVFIISNGHVYYRSQQLPLEADSFEVLKYLDGHPIISCGGTTYAGSFVKDRNGIYALYVTGELDKLNVAETTDASAPEAYAHKEYVRPKDGFGSLFYKDRQTLYFFDNTAKESGNLENLYDGDSKTFEAYAVLNSKIVFRDKTGIYLSGRDYFSSHNFIKLIHGEAKLVCLEADYLCLLDGNKLYHVYDNGAISYRAVDARWLQCIQAGQQIPDTPTINTANGICFDYNRIYNKTDLQWMQGDTSKLRPYAETPEELEQKRIDSLEKIKIEQKPLLIEEKPENGDLQRLGPA